MSNQLQLSKIIQYLLALWLFVLPWQTRFRYQRAFLNGGYWEYGTLSVYATELLGWGIIGLFGIYLLKLQITNEKLRIKERLKIIRKVFIISTLILFFFIFHSAAPVVSLQWIVRGLQSICLGVIIVQRTTRPSSSPHPSALTPNTYNLTPATLFPLSFWLGGVAQALLGLWQFTVQYIPANKWLGLAMHRPADLGAVVIEQGGERILRAYGAFGSPNSLGIYLAVILVSGLILFLGLEDKKIKRLVGIGQLVILSGLLVSFSRGAWLSAGMGLLTVALVRLRNTFWNHSGGKMLIKNVWPMFQSIGWYGVVVVSFWLIFYPLVSVRVAAVGRLENRSLGERRAQWSEAAPIFKDNWLLGVGPGAYTAVLPQYYPGRPAWQYQPIHNVYALAIVEWGLLGTLSWLFFLGRWLQKLGPQLGSWAAGSGAVLLTAGLFDHWLWSLYTGVVLWGVVMGLSLLVQNKKRTGADTFL